METGIVFIPSGGVTSPAGFSAGATGAGIKNNGEAILDLGILRSDVSCDAAAVFTTNKVKAAPVILNRQRLERGRATAVIMNSGCANACNGERGLADAAEMAVLAARHIGIAPDDVLVASTGVIGPCLPMERIRAAIPDITLSAEGGHEVARAIMTTDTVPKEAAVKSSGGFVIGGMAKGSGMIHPDMATMLCFLTTDAKVDRAFLGAALKSAVDVTFNMISVDGDTSTNDMVLLMANGHAGSETITTGSAGAEAFQQALDEVCRYLARAIAADAEGATKRIEVTVGSAASSADARLAARTIVNSPLVKSAVHGSDPNWGRVLAAAGRSGAALEQDRLDLSIGGIQVVKNGCPVAFDEREVVKALDGRDVTIVLNLNAGNAIATAWGCDLSEEYVTINSEYTT